MSARLRQPRKLPEEPGLADPGLPYELDRDRGAPIELVEGVIERAELVGTPDEVRVSQGHVPQRARINQGRRIEKSGCRIRVAP